MRYRHLAALLLVLPVPLAAQTYGFVTRLGRDTVALERVVRTSQEIVGDAIERYPQVVVRHYDAFINPDGTVRRFAVNNSFPNPLPGQLARQSFIVDFSADSLHITIHRGDSARTVAVDIAGKFVMPWLLATYATYEQLLLAALKKPGDSIAVAQYTPGQQSLSHTTVRRLKGDSVSLTFFDLPLYARVDQATGRMLSLSGEHTTDKVVVERVNTPPILAPVIERFSAAEKARGVARSMSSHDTVRVTIGVAQMRVDYGRPMLRGRKALGNPTLVPFDSVWRTGADAATQFTTTASLSLGGVELMPGTYSLWTMPTRTGAMLIVNRQHGQWGTEYDPEQDVGRVALKSEALPASIEQFTIRIVPISDTTGSLVLEWERFRWTAAITVR
jgi:hypothetical protein